MLGEQWHDPRRAQLSGLLDDGVHEPALGQRLEEGHRAGQGRVDDSLAHGDTHGALVRHEDRAARLDARAV